MTEMQQKRISRGDDLLSQEAAAWQHDRPFVRRPDGTRLHVKEWGAGRPVVLIHTWPLNADCLDHIGYALALSGYRVIAYDRRGFGRSSQPWDGYGYDTLADDLAAILRALQVTDATLVGYSMGGGEVVRYISRHKEQRVAQLAFISTQVFGLRKTVDNPAGIDPAQFEVLKSAIATDRAQFFSEYFLPDMYDVGFHAGTVSQETVNWSFQMAMMASIRALIVTVDSWGLTDFEQDIASIDLPTLVIHGTADKMIPIAASGARGRFPIRGARVIEYEGAPHGLAASHPGRLIDDLLSFLGSH